MKFFSFLYSLAGFPAEESALTEEVKKLTAENELLKEQIERLEDHVGIDGLTGTSTRRIFEHELDTLLKIIRGEIQENREGQKVIREISLIFVDLDHFKRVNDTYGHSVGDVVLKQVAALLMSSVRETDTVARVGGEEFVVLLRGAGEEFAARDAEKFRTRIEQFSFPDIPALKVTASFGVCSSKNSTEAKALYECADKALYKAKRGGRNRVVVYGRL